MKKLVFMFVAMAAVSFASCGGSEIRVVRMTLTLCLLLQLKKLLLTLTLLILLLLTATL